MLSIIDTHKDDYDLCLLAAKTVLKVVTNHQIVFEHQEMAIIKKFNRALEHLGEDSGDKAYSQRSSPRTIIISDVSHRSIAKESNTQE